MKHALLSLIGLVATSVLSGTALAVTPSTSADVTLNTAVGDVNRGAYLARASGCIACHSDFDSGGKPLAGGAPIVTPFGTFYAPNLTTDPSYGIGRWTLEDFTRALREGVSPDGDPYYPAFPYSFYTRLSDQDIADLWVAFKTVPPVAKGAPEHELSFPFNIRSGLLIWQGMFFKPERFRPDDGRDEIYNRGAYLVESAAHCGACHTPRNLMGALDLSATFEGADGLPEGGKSPAITAHALKSKGWTVDDLAYALKSGITPDGDVFGGTMGEVVRDGTSFLAPDDLKAIAHYLLMRKP